jgi:alpha-L-rhamnosidase
MTDEQSPTIGRVAVEGVRFEHRADALGVGVAMPRLSWTIVTDTPGWWQSAYEIAVLDGAGEETTGRIASDQSVLVAWPFEPLSSRQQRTVRVRVWGTGDEEPSAWSAPQTVEAALLHADDWSARFIGPAAPEDTSLPQASPLLRKAFALRGDVRQARLYVTALGVYEPYLNGAVVGDHVLAPGWTSYNNRLRYQTFDVTALLQPGTNVVGAMVGDGWYRGRLSFNGGRRNIYGDRSALLAQLEITYADGTTDTIGTDTSWRTTAGPILASDIYDGETYDARRERPGWAAAGYDDSDWQDVRLVEHPLETLFAPTGPPVRRTQTMPAVEIITTPSGRTVVDFGQNVVGWLRLRVGGNTGHTITLRHAEVLEHGELATRPLRTARATDQYTLRGDGTETWEPRFTFHGFRYAEVENWPGTLALDDLEAVVVHSDIERTGWWESSDALLNRLHDNVVWGMRGNFLDVPTDCPQRDERLGWTGDIEVFAPSACFLFDVAGFLQSWLRDLAADQNEDGIVPFVVPNVIPGDPVPAAAWGDAAVIVPWVLYQRYGDSAILADQFNSMRAWVDHIAGRAGDSHLWNTGFQFGDWLDPSASPDNPAAAKTEAELVATAYFARSADLLAVAAGVIGRTDEQGTYGALAQRVRDAFAREYITPNGRMVNDATTAYSLAIQFGLMPSEEQRQRAGARLATLTRNSGYRISTGFVGTAIISDALTATGNHAAAYRLLMQQACPSWLYPVTMGATTIWERWDSLLPDGSVNPGEMTSFNHYALGAIADWLHRTVAGLAPAEPGYRRMAVAPRPGGGLTHAKARHRTPYGIAQAGWRIEGDEITVDVEVPPNTRARVVLPQGEGEPIEVGSGTHQWRYPFRTPARPRLTLQNTLGEFVEDGEAWDAVVAAFPVLAGREIGMGAMAQIPLEHMLGFISEGQASRADIEAALVALQREGEVG